MRQWSVVTALGVMVAVTFAVSARVPFAPGAATGQGFRIATAASMRPAVETLAARFHARTGIAAEIVTGSTGQIYAQIVRGAPYDLFMSADYERPARLAEEGRARASSLRVFALGRLAAWAPGSNCRPHCLPHALEARTLSIASPELAPYGLAAEECLAGRYRGRLVKGADVGQSFQFVATGNTAAGLVGLSQIRHGRRQGLVERNDFNILPSACHGPLRHALVIPSQNPKPAVAERFVEWLSSDEARAILSDAGFRPTGGATGDG